MSSSAKNIKLIIVDGVRWRTIVEVLKHVLQIAFTAILARLLSKYDFGIVAMAILVTRFIQSVGQIGLDTAAIQCQDLNNNQLSAILILQLVINFFLSLICFFLSPVAASFFDAQQLQAVLKYAAWSLFLDAAAFPMIILRKKLKFRYDAIFELVSLILANVIGIYFALSGVGVWALVYRMVSQKLFYAITCWIVSRWRPEKPSFSGLKPIVVYGANMLGSKLARYATQSLPGILLGKFMGAEVLGAYNVAYNLAFLPIQKLKNIFDSILFPSMSHLYKDPMIVKNNYKYVVTLCGAFLIPSMFGVSVFSYNIVIAIYGEKWIESAIYLKILALAGLVYGFLQLNRSFFMSIAKVQLLFRVSSLELWVSVVLVSLLGYYFKAIGIVFGQFLVYTIILVVSTYYLQRSLDCRNVFFGVVWKYLACSMLMYLILGFLIHHFPVIRKNFLYTFIFIIFSSVVYVRVLWFTQTELEKESLTNIVYSLLKIRL